MNAIFGCCAARCPPGWPCAPARRWRPGCGPTLGGLPRPRLRADGRYWKAGVAQGISADPYEKRLVTSGRRKPIVVGPRTIAVVVDGESHTLGAAVSDVAWLQ